MIGFIPIRETFYIILLKPDLIKDSGTLLLGQMFVLPHMTPTLGRRDVLGKDHLMPTFKIISAGAAALRLSVLSPSLRSKIPVSKHPSQCLIRTSQTSSILKWRRHTASKQGKQRAREKISATQSFSEIALLNKGCG